LMQDEHDIPRVVPRHIKGVAGEIQKEIREIGDIRLWLKLYDPSPYRNWERTQKSPLPQAEPVRYLRKPSGALRGRGTHITPDGLRAGEEWEKDGKVTRD